MTLSLSSKELWSDQFRSWRRRRYKYSNTDSRQTNLDPGEGDYTIFRHKSLTIAESRQIDGSRYWHSSDMGLPLAAVHRWGNKCGVEKAWCIDYLKNSAYVHKLGGR